MRTMGTRVDTTEIDDDWLRQWTVPEEDRAKHTSEAWRGEARWFRAPNIVCLEKYQRLKASAPPALRRPNGQCHDPR
jgi:hypothetical protein